MSIEKQAAVLNSLKNFIQTNRNRITTEVRRTRPFHVMAARDKGYSGVSWGLDLAADNDALGAKTLRKGYQRAQYRLSQADTALGTLFRGDAKPDSWRYKLFTDIKGSKVPVKQNANGKIVYDLKNKSGQGLTKQMDRASVSAPVKSMAGPVIAGLAFSQADKIADKMRNKKIEEVPY